MSNRVPAYRQAQIEIKKFIEDRKLRFGDSLPPEGVLAQELGISRPSLREAMKSLESLGVVESRHGEGIYVKAFSFDSIIENLPYAFVADGRSIRDLLQVRAAIELGSVPAVLQQIPPEDVQALRELANAMLKKAKAGEEYEEEDRQFHATMYRCLGNTFLSKLTDMFWRVFHRMDQTGEPPTRKMLEASARDHAGIVKMIEAKDLQGLMSAYEKHFNTLLGRLGAAPQGKAA
ncbi:FadR/GntR family transcriptional regulator [Paraburkholderia unamae]|uniref:GntR family transcriptional regulator n=1 Tax=Paraburkholderia unamae TaxID=219649 RepID=A0ABX5KKY8_9BURK|nr:FadR/GntR family transcriptional regulator [Paraburkholderia unamae]PVX81156.1 GntR family transcriptional regulator [Paraburkholderia unamae]CAG9261652.1 DNA-binding transcriptional regulator, FadR family [Paraburkholderia unamae]